MMHLAAFQFVERMARRRPSGLVLEIGGRDINGSVRPLFDDDPYIAIDLVPGPGVDVVADGTTFEPSIRPACVVCCEVLEHTPEASEIVRHAFHILRPGGVLILTMAGPGRAAHSAVDGGPLQPGEYYRNIEPNDLGIWLAPFLEAAIMENPAEGDLYAVASKGLVSG